MITHISGKLLNKKPGSVVVEAAGLGYEVAVPLSTFLALPQPGATVNLYTKLFVREDSWDLYGFLTDLERETFLALTAVNRLGPKLALTIISALEPLELARALMTRDLSTLAAIKGIGPKTAERLLLELKDKAPRLAALAGLKEENLAAQSEAAPLVSETAEAVSALVNLGYTEAEAKKAVAWAHKEMGGPTELEETLRLAFKFLTSKK